MKTGLNNVVLQPTKPTSCCNFITTTLKPSWRAAQHCSVLYSSTGNNLSVFCRVHSRYENSNYNQELALHFHITNNKSLSILFLYSNEFKKIKIPVIIPTSSLSICVRKSSNVKIWSTVILLFCRWSPLFCTYPCDEGTMTSFRRLFAGC